MTCSIEIGTLTLFFSYKRFSTDEIQIKCILNLNLNSQYIFVVLCKIIIMYTEKPVVCILLKTY